MASDRNPGVKDAHRENRRRPPVRMQRLVIPPIAALGTCCLVVLVLVISGNLCRGATGAVFIRLRRLAVAFGCAAIASCLLCHFVDPGKPRPGSDDVAPADENDDAQRVRVRHLPSGQVFRQKWCRDCRIWRPPRCGHCHFCGRCVLRLDHHCGFMGTCVGEHNQRFFVSFLACAGIGIGFVVASSFVYMHEMGCWSSMTPWTERPEPFAIIAFLFCCPPVPCMCTAIGSPALFCAGFFYSGMMLADTAVREDDGKEKIINMKEGTFFLNEIKALINCRGAWVYCCGPLALRWVPAASKAVSPPTSPSAVEMGMPQVESPDEQDVLL
mmetsp:Transcript_3853/g.7694  ORF Transcript_3853/g.7694 Transcript_3853/m.7694 type:complete len:327 (+) Transcript_3853:55-1035(+)